MWALWTWENGKEQTLEVTLSEQFHLDWWWGDRPKEQVESCEIYAIHFVTWTALLKVARSLSGRPSVWGCNGNSTHGKGHLLRWKPMQNDLQDNEPCRDQKGRTNPPTAAGSCHVMPCQCSKATGEEVPRVECKFMSLVKYRPAMFCSGRNLLSKFSFRECMSQTKTSTVNCPSTLIFPIALCNKRSNGGEANLDDSRHWYSESPWSVPSASALRSYRGWSHGK